MAKATSNRANKRALQKAGPSKGADLPAKGPGSLSGADRTAAWRAPDQLGNAKKRLRGIARVKTRMWEST